MMDTLTILVKDGSVPVKLASPSEGTNLVGLVVVPSVFGLAPDLLDTMQAFAEAGALVAGVDPFWRIQPGVLPYDDLPPALARSRQTTVSTVLSDVGAVADYLRAHARSNGRVIGLGICFGGRYCILANAEGKLDGFVNWHGGGLTDLLERVEQLRGPMCFHFAGEDRFVPLDQVKQVEAALSSREEVEIVIHPGIHHGFTHAGAAADPVAAEAARRSVVALVKQQS